MKQTFKFTMGRVAGITRVEQASDQNLVPPPPKPVTGKKNYSLFSNKLYQMFPHAIQNVTIFGTIIRTWEIRVGLMKL